ncbi:hypothetical protein CRG98_034216, partial [Punica granatum]
MASTLFGDCSTSSAARLLPLHRHTTISLLFRRLLPQSLPRQLGPSRTPTSLRALSFPYSTSSSPSPAPPAV